MKCILPLWFDLNWDYNIIIILLINIKICMEEIWKDILQNNLYQVSNLWNIKRKWYDVFDKWKWFRYHRQEKILKQINRWKYLAININKKFFAIHRLVAQAFHW